MFDAHLRPAIDPPLNWAGRRLAHSGIDANTVTLAGLGLGLVCALLIALGYTSWALLFLAASRIADGLDGAIARATRKTDFGGYLDIVCDFAFYGAVPLGFVFLDPNQNALAGATLLCAFYVNGASFLGYALLAEKHDLSTTAQGEKSLYYSNGLLEGGETIMFFVAICLWPALFPPLAWGFAALCFATTVLRIIGAWRVFHDRS